MASETLLFSSVMSIVSAAIYAYVGVRLGRRRVNGEGQRAVTLFSVWWFALSGTSLVGGLLTLAGAFGFTDLNVHVALTHLSLLAICVALWALLYYLLYLFTGRTGVIWPLSAFYVVYYAALVYIISSAQPTGVEIARWNVKVDYLHEIGGPIASAVILLLLLPQILGAIAYFTLFFKVDAPTQKYRIALVSMSIVVWFSVSLVAAFAGLSESDGWQVASRFISLAAAGTILAAYLPPGWVQKRYKVDSIEPRPA